jgi:hypothetical protein
VLTSEWFKHTALYQARRSHHVLCVALPFLQIPGIMEQVFVGSAISYVSLVPRPGTITPDLTPNRRSPLRVPLLSLHTKLVQAYWSTRALWRPWAWLEQDFAVLCRGGFNFRRGSIGQYNRAIQRASGQFAASVKEIAASLGVSAIAVYGRGHWTMNAAALAANNLGLPLYVLERGIYPNSYIVDRDVPFSAPRSMYRSSWRLFHRVTERVRLTFRTIEESRWQLYHQALGRPYSKNISLRNPRRILVGQCYFDYNCLDAPFSNPSAFIEFVQNERPETKERRGLLYRPHPLSPEEFPKNEIMTRYGPVPVDLSAPWEMLESKPTLYTWNSTLGLEGALVFGTPLNILDTRCHYKWVNNCTDSDRKRYMTFLGAISVFCKGSSA